MSHNHNIETEKVKLDEILKYLFSTSKKVLVKLLNGIFEESFDDDDVELTVSNNEFVEDEREAADLFEKDEILAEDFHKMLVAINNLIEYLNRNFINDNEIEEEVTKVTKTLYDPEVAKKAKSDLIIKLLKKKLNELTQEYILKIKSLSDEKLEQIGEAIFDIATISDLDKYLN